MDMAHFSTDKEEYFDTSTRIFQRDTCDSEQVETIVHSVEKVLFVLLSESCVFAEKKNSYKNKFLWIQT